MTELFEQGQINALVGTKSLLGEGWDAPCINSLILATYVGSFMLSNQMRGRTIRTDKNIRRRPAISGIWPVSSPRRRGRKSIRISPGTMRHWSAGLTLSWGYPGREPVIESGIGRLGIPGVDTRMRWKRSMRPCS